jgi:hypothetical protein
VPIKKSFFSFMFLKSTHFRLGAGIAQWYSAGLRSWMIGGSRLGNFLFTAVSRPALGPTQTPIQWIPRALSLGVKRRGREADHSPPSSAEVKNCVQLYLHSPNTPSWRGAKLQNRDNFNFYTFSVFIYNIYQDFINVTEIIQI